MITEQQKNNFLKKFKQGTPDKCWEWHGAKNGIRGYGVFNLNKCTKFAHRISYELFVGEIPEGMCVCHICDNRICVNPNHLWLGTQSDNLKDCVKKGRSVAKLTEVNVMEIKNNNSKTKELSKKFNISQRQIRYIKTRILSEKEKTNEI